MPASGTGRTSEGSSETDRTLIVLTDLDEAERGDGDDDLATLGVGDGEHPALDSERVAEFLLDLLYGEVRLHHQFAVHGTHTDLDFHMCRLSTRDRKSTRLNSSHVKI